jgi:hypothetical protein
MVKTPSGTEIARMLTLWFQVKRLKFLDKQEKVLSRGQKGLDKGKPLCLERGVSLGRHAGLVESDRGLIIIICV